MLGMRGAGSILLPKMSDSKSGCSEAGAPGGKSLWLQRNLLVLVCALVIGVYGYIAHRGEWWSPNPSDAHYNLLVQGFRAGQLSLKKEAPSGLMRLPDPYDPTANEPYRIGPDHLHDLSYYKGRLYLYFGITPVLILFWPFVALTGQYLPHRQAAVIFSGLGFLVSVGLVRALWRRYFSEVSVWVVAGGALALGLATAVPVMLPRSGIYEVAISCGYLLTMLTLAAIWHALHDTEQRCRWLMAASVTYGLALGARPSLLFGAVILLVPVLRAWRERQPIRAALMAATVPITLIGLALMLYNELRFDNPAEFGLRYQLTEEPQLTRQYFHLRYLWFNFQVYFLEPARWSTRFPFVHEINAPPWPAGYARVENPFGVLTNIPLVWLALAAPLAWRNRPGQEVSILRWFTATVALLFGICALTLLFFESAIFRYEVDFLPALVLLAVIGFLGLERALAGQRVWRRAMHCGWGLLLGFSVAFGLLASLQVYANERYAFGIALLQARPPPEAIQVFEEVLRLKPDYAQAHNHLGTALMKQGRLQEAIGHYEQAVRLKPDYAMAYYNLGVALEQTGRLQEAIQRYEQALRIKPDLVQAQKALTRARSVQ
jgi:tetratricopeptide (TPR) repeat protein